MHNRWPIEEIPTKVTPAVSANSIEEISTKVTPAVSANSIEEIPTKVTPAVSANSIEEIPTKVTPAVSAKAIADIETPALKVAASVYVVQVRSLVKGAGIYAIASIAPPLVALVLASFLTHVDSLIVTLLATLVNLGAGSVQLGWASAFFRYYSYISILSHDRRNIMATTTILLCLITMVMILGMIILGPFLAGLLFGQTSLGDLVALADGVVLLQNITVPGIAWLLAEKRASFYTMVSIGNLLVTLMSTLLLVGVFHLGVAGWLIALGCGYTSVIFFILPSILRAEIKIYIDFAHKMIIFACPLILNFISYWVLPLTDRYLLSLFGSFEQISHYAIVYTIGSALSVVIIAPFTLAWSITLFVIAKYEDAAQFFRSVFCWFGLLLLFAAFGLSLVGTILLDWLFPVTYHSVAFMIPVVAESIVLYGIYFILMIGSDMKHKIWMSVFCVSVAMLVNSGLNIILIPQYGAMGAAVATLDACIVLTLIAYVVNQRSYPISFEIERFIIALLVGIVLYVGSSFFAQSQAIYGECACYLASLMLYAGCLAVLIKHPAWLQASSAS